MCWQSYVARSSSTASPGASGQAFHCHPQEIIANTRIHLFMLHLDYLTLFNVVTYQRCLTLQLHFLSDRDRQNWACTSLDSSTHIWFFFSPQILPVCSYSLQYLIWFCLGPKVNYWLKKRDLYGTVELRLFFFFSQSPLPSSCEQLCVPVAFHAWPVPLNGSHMTLLVTVCNIRCSQQESSAHRISASVLRRRLLLSLERSSSCRGWSS